jgi:hypothetical protein
MQLELVRQPVDVGSVHLTSFKVDPPLFMTDPRALM